MLIFKHLFLACAILYNAVMAIVGMCSNKGIMYKPPYLAYLKILHLLEEAIVFVFQHSSRFIYHQSCIMTTSLSEDCAVCGKSFKRLGAHLVHSLACGSYFMPRRADTGSNLSESADHGTCPNLRSSLYNTLFRAHCVTVRGEAEDNPPIINVNGHDDDDFVVIDDDDMFHKGKVDEKDVPTNASKGEEGPDAGLLDLYLKLFHL